MEENIMPYTMIEQKLSKGQIRTVNYFDADVNMINSGESKYSRNGESISGVEYESVRNEFNAHIDFVENSAENRALYGVN